MKTLNLFIILAIFIGHFGCGAPKNVQPVRTLAQICADSFPPPDTLIMVEVDVPVKVEVEKIVYRDTFICPPSDTASTMVQEKEFLVPGKEYVIKTVVQTRVQIDSALRKAYTELQAQYKTVIDDLEACNTKMKSIKKAKPSADWKVWLVCIGLLLVVVSQAIFRKKDRQ